MEDITPDPSGTRLGPELKKAAAAVKRASTVLVVTHIDADGITAGTIAAITLERLGKKFLLDFRKRIAADTVEDINTSYADLVWVCDLGSAYMSQFTRDGLIVTDHHVPDPDWRTKGQTSIDSYRGSYQLNPHLVGLSGSYQVCGAGMTYLLSKEIDPANRDLAYLAVVGAIGDFQDDRCSKLVGWNRLVLQDAIDNGDVSVVNGVRYFGRESRGVVSYLQYGEPAVHGLTDSRESCQDLLAHYGIEEFDGEGRRLTWSDLEPGDRAVIADELVTHADPEDRPAIIGEVYLIDRYQPHSGLHDAKEFATMLNSCGRYGDYQTGVRLCRGDLSALKDAERNRDDHRKSIASALSYVKTNHLIRRRRYLQWFDAGGEIRDTVVGIVAGMLLGNGDAEGDLPIVAFAVSDEGVKVSARAPRELVAQGLDLSAAMKEAAEAVGGLGGGHTVAAGAEIPDGKKEAFLDAAEAAIEKQLSGKVPGKKEE
ncbi:MAG: DHHA1 domain-containing protein [Methanomethylophilus sp.]|jgi:single-stranded-DNA-specific exonuclease